MAKKIVFENGRIFNFEDLVTLTLDRVILHTVVHHSSTLPTCQISLKSKKCFVDRRTDVCTYVRTDGRTCETGLTTLTLSKSRPNNGKHKTVSCISNTVADCIGMAVSSSCSLATLSASKRLVISW